MTRSRLVRAFVPASLLVLLSVAGGRPAAAHAKVAATEPKADATVDAWPGRVAIRFDEDVTEPTIKATGTDGVDLVSGPVTSSASTVQARLRAGSAPGAVTVRWSARSGDGDAIDGTFTFTVSAAATTTTTVATSTTVAPATTVAAATTTIAAPAPIVPDDGTTGKVVSFALGIAVVLVVAVVLARIGRRKPDAGGEG